MNLGFPRFASMGGGGGGSSRVPSPYDAAPGASGWNFLPDGTPYPTGTVPQYASGAPVAGSAAGRYMTQHGPGAGSYGTGSYQPVNRFQMPTTDAIRSDPTAFAANPNPGQYTHDPAYTASADAAYQASPRAQDLQERNQNYYQQRGRPLPGFSAPANASYGFGASAVPFGRPMAAGSSRDPLAGIQSARPAGVNRLDPSTTGVPSGLRPGSGERDLAQFAAMMQGNTSPMGQSPMSGYRARSNQKF